MKHEDLLAEAHAYEKGMLSQIEKLERLGVLTGLALIGQNQPAVGLARIERLRGGLWQPSPGGELAMVVPVCRPKVIEPFENVLVETIECIDIVAFTSRAPQLWCWRTGLGWALGEHLIEEGDEALRLVSTPLSWLRSGGEAACILDWSETSPAWRHLQQAASIRAEDPQLLHRLDVMLKRTRRGPSLAVAHAA